jgi:two-component system cell cycle response regulator
MNKTILIVDDEPAVLDAVSRLVRHEGYDVMLAESGEAALAILAKRAFDLVMTDLMMPGITGWEVLEATKKQYPQTKVVVFTGYINEQGESLLVDRNADGFLVKPLRLEKLKNLLAALLQEEEIVGGRIFAVDDEPITRMLIEVTLAEAGHDVVTFASANEALEAAHSDPPDLFLIDLQMPEVDGFELCSQIRDIESIRDTSIIIVTGQTDRASVLRALNLGIQGFVAKPHEPEALVDKVRKALAQTSRGEDGGA